jgi:hypothetical protein
MYCGLAMNYRPRISGLAGWVLASVCSLDAPPIGERAATRRRNASEGGDKPPV